MGSICKQAENEQNTQSIVVMKVQVKNIPDRQQQLEKYIYNLKDNVDRFEDEFFQKSFTLEILNQNRYQSEVESEIFDRQDQSQNNSIENSFDLATESMQGSSFLVLKEEHQNKNNKNRICNQSKFYQKYRYNSENNSPYKSILKIPQFNEKIRSTERYLSNDMDKRGKKKKRVRFMQSDLKSGSSAEWKVQKERVKRNNKTIIKV